jgi:glycine dehydrogenase
MKLNATSEMAPITWPEFADIHPFAPADQVEGYLELIEDLERGWRRSPASTPSACSPTPAAQGEYAGLLAIRAYHRSRGDDDRTCA